MTDPAGAFEQYRPLLLGLAYQLLGSMWDAEDAVQDAYLRWMGTDQAQVREPQAFLMTVVSRLALDQLRSARVTRAAYPGPWLPEPVSTGPGGPLETAELRDTLSYATLHMMERLSPPERAVFVLREAFGLPYQQIAAVVQAPAATCRQMYHRAQKQLATGSDRFQPPPAEHAALVKRFLLAAQGVDLDGLSALLAEDVTAWNDGGGKARAAPRPVQGRDRVLRFLAGLIGRYAMQDVRLIDANGALAAWMVMGRQEQLVAFDTSSGVVRGIYGVLNPDKLAFIRP
jgi:RNA polymerase sigma-70 factor (ECF subfamily)